MPSSSNLKQGAAPTKIRPVPERKARNCISTGDTSSHAGRSKKAGTIIAAWNSHLGRPRLSS
nr:MAG TPA: hypothetical protein [Caudoviricetes sp.]